MRDAHNQRRCAFQRDVVNLVLFSVYNAADVQDCDVRRLGLLGRDVASADRQLCAL